MMAGIGIGVRTARRVDLTEVDRLEVIWTRRCCVYMCVSVCARDISYGDVTF